MTSWYSLLFTYISQVYFIPCRWEDVNMREIILIMGYIDVNPHRKIVILFN